MSSTVDTIHVGSEAELERLKGLLPSELVHLPVVDHFEGIRGFLAGRNGEDAVVIACRFAEPVQTETIYGSAPMKSELLATALLAKAKASMEKCLTEPGWVQAHRPAERLVGFVHHQRRQACLFSVTVLKALGDDLFVRFNEWRAKSPEASQE